MGDHVGIPGVVLLLFFFPASEADCDDLLLAIISFFVGAVLLALSTLVFSVFSLGCRYGREKGA